MKKILSAVAASALFSVAGLASAAEPMQLTDNQMDHVSAGLVGQSIAAGTGFALLGTVVSNTGAGSSFTLTPISANSTTWANSFNLSTGLLVTASSQAAAGF